MGDTPGLEKLSGGNSKMEFPTIPIKHASTKAEIASSALYLRLNEAITGHWMVVDGGEWFGKQAYMPREMVSRISRGVEKGSRNMGPGDSAPAGKSKLQSIVTWLCLQSLLRP